MTTFKEAYDANPATTLLDTDVLALSRSPHAASTDAAGMDGAALKEIIRDLIAGFAVSGANISITHNDGADTLTFAFTGTVPASTTDLPEGTNLYFTDERAQDAVGAMAGASLVYVDGTPLLARAALTGDVTAAQNDNAMTIAAGAVTNAKLADMANSTVKGRTTAGTGDPEDMTAAQTRAVIGISTPASALLNMGMAFTTGNVADDAAASVALGNFNGGTMIIQANVTAGGMGLFFIRTNTTVSAEIVAQIGTTVAVVAGDGALTGTTGTDGKTNIRADSAAGLLWIENRTGAVRGYTVYFFRQ